MDEVKGEDSGWMKSGSVCLHRMSEKGGEEEEEEEVCICG
jgi:hypothetical protein